MEQLARLEAMATQVRRDSLRMIHAASSGHPGGALGCADYLVALYFKALESPTPCHPDGKDQDMFFLSNGHISAGWYSVLARSGHFEVSELATFRRLGTRLQGHPTPAEGLPGVRIASGSLGQGLSVGIGAALGKKLKGDKHLVYTLHGDGELQEGQIWEAAMFAAAKKVDNIIATVDYNGAQIDGPVEEVVSLGDLKAKWDAFGWTTLETNGNDMAQLLQTLEEAKAQTGKGKPIVILMRTRMGAGVEFMSGDYKWHGKAPSDEQLQQALEDLGQTELGDY